MYQAQKQGYERDVSAGKITAERPNNNLAGLTHRFRDKVQAAMAAGNYSGLLDDGIRNCVRALPWWQGAGSSSGSSSSGGVPAGSGARRHMCARRRRRLSCWWSSLADLLRRR